MGDHRKLKTYKKKPKELKRSRPIGAEHILQVTAERDDAERLGSIEAFSSSSNKTSSGRLPTTAVAGSSRSDVVDDSDSKGTGSGCGTMGRKSHRSEKDPAGKKSGPVKERWLLTRKTWKYMQQAGRRLIPDGSQNRAEDLPKIEEYFQQVCRSEQRFIIWSRKSSYPGAMAASRKLKRRLRASTRHTRSQQKASSADEAEIDEFKENDRRAALVIRLLHTYLNTAEQEQPQQQSQSHLQSQSQFKSQSQLNSQVQAEQRTPSQRSTGTYNRDPSTSETKYSSISVSTSSFSPQQQRVGSSSSPTYTSADYSSAARQSELSKRTAELLESLRQYSQAAHRPIIPPEHITTDLLHNKTLLKKIYNDLKRQQLSLVLNRHTAASTNNLSHASSLTSLFNFRRDTNKSSPTSALNVKLRSAGKTDDSPLEDCKSITVEGNLQIPKEKYIRPTNQLVPYISAVKPAKTFTTQGMQTDFLQLHELNNLRKEFEIRKKELDLMNQAPEEEVELTPRSHSRRKSSVDNEDVSQSVSDTIKRYLRMARKKSVNDDAANRFKRVNYDRNLRNIRAKGEINPPGMDEGNSKTTQTLDAWPLLHYNFIRGIDCEILLAESHIEWTNALQRRNQQQEEYLQQQQQLQQQKDASHSSGKIFGLGSPPQQHSPGASTGTPTSGSGGGIFHSGTQFFSNLWHGYHHSAHDNSNNSTTSTTINVTSSCNTSTTTSNTTTNSLYNNATANNPPNVSFNQHHNQTTAQQQQQQQQYLSPTAKTSGSNTSLATSTMQKSKSSSNVGQFVSKKIWKSRSKSQSRMPAANKPQWAPQGNCVWMSPSGKRVILADVKLRDLTEIERKILHRVAIEKINQLNIGVNVQAPGDITGSSSKSQKRRPLLIKRKALTTSIFDTSKKEDNKVNGSGLVFGVSIEKCVDNDRLQKAGVGIGVGSSTVGSDRGSRNSVISLLGGGNHNKGNDHIGSCESLPSRSTNIISQYDDGGGGKASGTNSFISRAAMKLSRSQTDVRRGSQDEDDLLAEGHDIPAMVGGDSSFGQQVPALVLECIKHIEEHGLNTVGIFRVSTSKKRVRQLKDGFDRGEIISIDSDICPHDAATILKEYFRDLPEPLLCRNLYKAFVKTQKIRNRRLQLEALSHLIQLLPVAHRDTLYVLLRFLAKIVRSSDDVITNDTVVTGNKMDSNNLATVIAPNILRSPETGRTTEQEIDEQIDVINVIRTMIDHYEELFRVPAELMDEIYTNMMDTYPEQLDYLCERRDVTGRYDDDMDSGSSSTPLSSPPPIVLKQHNSAFTTTSIPQSSMVDDDGGGGGIGTGGGPRGSSGNINDRTFVSNRPVYSRDDFLHENTIKGDDPKENAAGQRRERTSRMKYVESEHELTRRRRRERNSDESGSAATPSPTKTTFNSSSTNRLPFGDSPQQQSQNQQSGGPVRRHFPPYGDQDGNGVVTASLKIPVQMQQQSQQYPRSQSNICDTTNSGHIDLSDIPYIEDNGCGQDVLTGSLLFGRGSYSATSNQMPVSIEGRTTSSSSTMSDLSRSSTIHQYTTDDTSAGTSAASSRRSSAEQALKSPTPITISQQQAKRPDSLKRSPGRKQPNNINTSGGGDGSPNAVLSPTTLIGQFGTLQSGHHHGPNTEPKLTPSISNIGGAVLRSKTADFERISKQNKKYKTNDTTTGADDFAAASGSVMAQVTSASDITGSGSSSSIRDEAAKSEKSTRSRQQTPSSTSTSGPIYKRQELISSAQRSSK